MALPFFYIKNYESSQKEFQLDEDTSRHIVQVLRMKPGEKLNLTDGKGNLLEAEIIHDHKKHCDVRITDSRFTPHGSQQITIAISLLKNPSRFEWFLEKATEIGVSEIIPLICERTEKTSFKFERMKGILVSAMLQSQQCRLPLLKEPVKFKELVVRATHQQKFIAHCTDDAKRDLVDLVNSNLSSKIILIGPEGDFTNPEIELALQNHFNAVTLGKTRLRTETAGLVAATLLTIS